MCLFPDFRAAPGLPQLRVRRAGPLCGIATAHSGAKDMVHALLRKSLAASQRGHKTHSHWRPVVALFAGLSSVRERILWQTDVRSGSLKARIDDGVLIVSIQAVHLLDDVVADGFLRDLLSVVAHTGARNVVIVLSAVHSIGSAAYEALGTLEKELNREGGRLVLTGLSPAVEEMFRLERAVAMDGQPAMKIAADLPTARRYLKRPTARAQPAKG